MRLICDGLDEIALPESTEAANVTTDFIQALSIWLGNRNSGGCYARAIVLGRTIAAEEAFRKLGINWPALLRVAGLLPIIETEDWESKKKKGLVSDPNNLEERDDRRTYWSNWCDAKNDEDTDIPEALLGKTAAAIALKELTTEPLLLYLLIWTGFLGDRWQEAADNRNVVYHEIFKKIYDRDWSESAIAKNNRVNLQKGGHPLAREIKLEEFLTLQEALGLASWATGGRTVTEESFNSIVKIYLGEDQLEDLERDANISLKSIALQS